MEGIVEMLSYEMIALNFVMSPEVSSEMSDFSPETLLISAKLC